MRSPARAAGTRLRHARLILIVLLSPPLLVALLTTIGPLHLDPVAAWAGIGIGHHPGWLPGFVSIDPNMGTTSFALGVRAALQTLSGTLPLWNHYEGLGAPLLGEMQSAALFPPTWLLVLPHGQAIEQALLQALAGLGTYLFLRRFGLGTTAALAGGLLFEFNGVFAWLRNAVYNPVAFLPWLFYTVESLFHLHRGIPNQPRPNQPRPTQLRPNRRRPIALGAIMAALSVYAGFPEIVYFNALLLAAWALLRATTLPWRRALAFGTDLLTVAGLAALIASPLLIAFAHFLREAAVGGHHGLEFQDHVLPPHAFILAMLPYVFGPISAAPQAAIAAVWGDIGGYIGLTPLLLAIAGLLCTWRHATTRLLTAWIVLAVGASHGVPLLHAALNAIPLVTIAAYCRYLDASWIFACIVLGATFIDRVATTPLAQNRRVAATACVIGLAGIALGLAAAWPVLIGLAAAETWQVQAILLSLATAAALFCLFLLATRRRHPAKSLATLAVAEAILWFMLPFASTPRFAGVDRPLIDFLRDHTGFQRFAIASGSGLGPNFGSVFGIPSMNYDDLPVPARTARFVTTRLDATNDGVIFGHNAPPASEADRRATRAGFVAALDGYAQAGVRYVLAVDDFDAHPAYPLAPNDAVAVPLRAGQHALIDLDGTPSSPEPIRTIGTASLLIGTYGGKADGALSLRLCQSARCASGTAPLAGAPDNRGLLIPLDTPFSLDPALPLQIAITKQGGQRDVALWLRPALDPASHLTLAAAPASHRPILDWIEATNPRPILRTATTTIFEIASPRPYATAPNCRLDLRTHDRIDAQCTAPSRLLRLEVFATGWRATVNGTDTPITPVEDTFQAVDLPAGPSRIDFTYAPPALRPAVPIALATLLLCLTLLVTADPPNLPRP